MKKKPTLRPMGNFFPNLHYPCNQGKRDLRIDFIRGLVMIILITVHIHMTSVYNYIAWERFGAVTGAEGFVLLSGIVLGMLSRIRLQSDGLSSTIHKQYNRGFTLYRVLLVVIFSVFLLDMIPWFDSSVVTTFTTYSGKVYHLYPPLSAFGDAYRLIIAKFLLLRYGPHQFQILGLYVVLMFIAPFVLWFLSKQRVGVILSISWILYLVNTGMHFRPIGANFEYAFPLLSWQILFIHGLVIGYYRNEIWNFFHGNKGRVLFVFIFILYLVFLFFTYNNPLKEIPSYLRLDYIEPKEFRRIYHAFFDKNTLGIGRLFNDFALLVVSYAMLSYLWKPINKLFGWFFIPIGQASLYVFILHVYASIVIANIGLFGAKDLMMNSLGHTAVFVFMWLMVRYKVFYNIIPR